MRIQIENVGPLKNAPVEFGDMTVVCGKNNNGKTHLAYVLCALMSNFANLYNLVSRMRDIIQHNLKNVEDVRNDCR